MEIKQSQAVLLLAVLKMSPSDLTLEELLSGLESPEAHWEPLQDFLQSIPGRASHDRALQGVDGSHAEEQQAGTAGGTESINMDCSLPGEQGLGGPSTCLPRDCLLQKLVFLVAHLCWGRLTY